MNVFLAATNGLDSERDIVRRVADRLNQRHGVAPGSRFYLEVVDWGRHLAPLLSERSVVLQRAPADEHDVFFGLAWLRFSPPASAALAAKQPFVPASERDFELAYRFWSRLNLPQCIFCRAMRLPASLHEIDGLELDRVMRFFSRFHPGEEGPFLFRELAGPEELEAFLEPQLAQIVRRLHDISRPAAGAAVAGAAVAGVAAAVSPSDTVAPSAPATPATEPQTPGAAGMMPGEAYAVSFLSIEIAGHEGLASKHRDRPELVLALEETFKQLVLTTAAEYSGHLFSWQLSGGLVVFRGKRSCDQAVMAGLKVLHNLPVFNLDPQQNPLSASIEVRAAVHDADILFQLPTSRIASPEIDFLLELQRQATSSGELCLARRPLERLDERLAGRFKPKGRYENEAIFVCRLPTSSRETRAANVEEFVGQLKHQVTLIETFLGTPGSPLELASAESIGSIGDEVYAILNKFCLAFASFDEGWTKEFLSQLADAAGLLRHQEAELWQHLRRRYAEGQSQGGTSDKLAALVQAAARRRSRPVVILEKIEERCRMLLSTETAPPAPRAGEGLAKKIDLFVRADELDVETALTDLLLNHKSALVAFLTGEPGDPRYLKLLDKLWETADLALLDDLCSIRGHERATDAKLFDALTGASIADGRFRVVRDLLAVAETIETPAIAHRFKSLGLEASDADLQIVWRSLLLAHPDDEQRARAAFRLSAHSMWQAISHPSIPLESIYAIGQRVAKSDGEDAQKIFFDCIRARLDTAVESFRTRDELAVLTNLIMLLLDFPFLVETGYFERFDDVLGKFLARAQKAGMRVEYFENIRKKLESLHTEAGDKGPSKLPSGVKSLPLTIQRRLAGEARYLLWFLTHPDPRIAGETLKHVSLSNVERVLRVREINGAVMSSILRRPEFFARSQPLLAALNHPKCDQGFAAKYVPGLARSRAGVAELQKITRNPSANPTVRSLAQRALGEKPAGVAGR